MEHKQQELVQGAINVNTYGSLTSPVIVQIVKAMPVDNVWRQFWIDATEMLWKGLDERRTVTKRALNYVWNVDEDGKDIPVPVQPEQATLEVSDDGLEDAQPAPAPEPEPEPEPTSSTDQPPA